MYSMGQLIYIYKESNNSLFPCVVCEEVVKKTLTGVETYYKVLLPDSEGTVVDLSKMDVKVFTSLSTFKEEFIKKANIEAEAAMGKCKEISNEKFKKFVELENPKEKNEKTKTEKIVVKDENNVRLNIDMSKLQELGI